MDQQQEFSFSTHSATDRHFRVVRFYTDFAIGVVREVLGAGLSYQEATEMAMRARESVVPGEDTVVEDERKQGLEAMVGDERSIDPSV